MSRFDYGFGPEDMAKKKGAEHARAGKVEQPDKHWPIHLRQAYRDAYQRVLRQEARQARG